MQHPFSRPVRNSEIAKHSMSWERRQASCGGGGDPRTLADYVLGGLGWDLEIITPTKAEPGFHVRPWCWIVERTLGWLTKNRRLSKDYERDPASSEALIRIRKNLNEARAAIDC